ncbi:MAG: hypothetical protein J6Y58_06970 [Clostridiales bacterium]|nr:hypothetical protein [Clostridiales bacterium]
MKMIFASGKNSGRQLARLMSVLFALCFFCGILTGCSGKAFQKKKIDAPEMARIVVDSLQDSSDKEELFNRIPEEQKDGMTFSEYYEYISVLQKMMPSGSRVSSFQILSGDAKDDLLNKMIFDETHEYSDLIRSCIPVQIQINGFRVSGMPIVIYLQTKDDGTVYLNRSWAKSCMELYSFSAHYFEAYSNENLTDVISLLSYTQSKEPLPSSRDILKEKAREMIRFYSHNVKSAYDDYEVVSIDASNLVYLQPAVLDSHLQTNRRKVRFSSNEEGEISVLDPIESELKTADLYLYYNGRRTVRVGEHAAPSQLETMFGKPISVSCGPVVEKAASGDPEDGHRNILIRYPGFTLTVYGVYHSAQDWDGTYTRFRIWDSEKAGIGTDLNVTKTSWDVLSRYPFADEVGYVLEVSIDGEKYQLQIGLDRENPEEDGSIPIDTLILHRIGN